jgi:hypothetical protein
MVIRRAKPPRPSAKTMSRFGLASSVAFLVTALFASIEVLYRAPLELSLGLLVH